MLLKAAPAFSLLNPQVENQGPLFSSVSSSQTSLFHSFSSSVHRLSSPGNGTGSVVVCAAKGANHKPLTGVIFEPFKEVKKELDLVPTVPQVSLARQKFTDECEASINEQIKFFKESSSEEREHAEKLMEYQNKRGGKVKLQSILMPLSEFDHAEKGDALYAMELALSLEKLTNEKLLNMHSVAVRNHDVQLTEFIEREYLAEQVEAIKKISEYVAQLRRVGKGHGVWHFDQMLLHEGEEAIA
ncbi:hypothetical protein V6N13_012713 [Hibiscus sabdariffa]